MFWTLNPRRLKPFDEAYKLDVKNQNTMLHMQGQYMMHALLATVGNMFRGRSSKIHEYPQEPFDIFAEKRMLITENMTDEEKARETEKLFGFLGDMQQKFEMNKANG